MADKKLNAFTAAAAWTATCSVVGSDSASPTGSFLWDKAAFDAVYGVKAAANTWAALNTFNAGLVAFVAGVGPTIGRDDGARMNLTFDTNGRALMKSNTEAQMSWIGDGLTVQLKSDVQLAWSSGNTPGTSDVGLKRNAAGIAEVNTGTPGTFGDLKVNNLWPASIYTGQTGNVTFLFSSGQHWGTLRNANLAMVLGSPMQLTWGDAANSVSSTIDTGLARATAGVVEINDGTVGGAGQLQLSEPGGDYLRLYIDPATKALFLIDQASNVFSVNVTPVP